MFFTKHSCCQQYRCRCIWGLNTSGFPEIHLGVKVLFTLFAEIFSVSLQKGFYGPHRRKMMLSGFFRFGVWQNFFRAWKNGYSGNLEGEGFTLGGVFVIGAGRQVLQAIQEAFMSPVRPKVYFLKLFSCWSVQLPQGD